MKQAIRREFLYLDNNDESYLRQHFLNFKTKKKLKAVFRQYYSYGQQYFNKKSIEYLASFNEQKKLLTEQKIEAIVMLAKDMIEQNFKNNEQLLVNIVKEECKKFFSHNEITIYCEESFFSVLTENYHQLDNENIKIKKVSKPLALLLKTDKCTNDLSICLQLKLAKELLKKIFV